MQEEISLFITKSFSMINSLDFPLKEGTLSLPLILRMFSLETEIFIPRNISVTAYFFAVFIPYKMFIHLFSNFHDLWWDACYYFCDCFSLCNVFFFSRCFQVIFLIFIFYGLLMMYLSILPFSFLMFQVHWVWINTFVPAIYSQCDSGT